jgi:hypothetical protein
MYFMAVKSFVSDHREILSSAGARERDKLTVRDWVRNDAKIYMLSVLRLHLRARWDPAANFSGGGGALINMFIRAHEGRTSVCFA